MFESSKLNTCNTREENEWTESAYVDEQDKVSLTKASPYNWSELVGAGFSQTGIRWNENRLIDYLGFYVPLKNISLKYENVTIAGEGLQNLSLC
jgi:hypothetical protein